MPSTPPTQQDPKADAGKRPPTRKRKQFRRSPQPRPKRARSTPLLSTVRSLSMAHPEPLSLRDMKKLRIKTGSLVPVSEIARVAQEMLRGMEPGWQVDHFLEFQIEPKALFLLQMEAERFLIEKIEKFDAAKTCTEHAGRTTMQVKDMKAVDMIHGMFKDLGRSFGAST